MRLFAWLSFFTCLSACGIQSNQQTHPSSKPSLKKESVTNDIRAGDVILVPLNCYVCNAIEAETGVPYSHSVVVANTTRDPASRLVFEAWGEVKRTAFSEIVSRKQKNQSLYLLRPKQFQSAPMQLGQKLNSVFEKNFRGLPFDDEYLWDNRDASGRDKLYCSEFVVKFLNSFLNAQIKTAPMSFQKNPDFWQRYFAQFNMVLPQGLPGTSPATLFFSDLMIQLGEIQSDK